jgi:peptide/nickel transport system permease protein
MNRLTYIGIFIAVILIFLAIFAPWLSTHDVTAINTGIKYAAPSAEHWFGTDALGRDVFSRLITGARISLQVGIVVTVVSVIIGVVIGAIAGFYGGWIDKILSGYIFNVFMAFPGLLLAIALVAFLGAGLGKLMLALCIIGWVGYARVMRGQVLKVREFDFVRSAQAICEFCLFIFCRMQFSR